MKKSEAACLFGVSLSLTQALRQDGVRRKIAPPAKKRSGSRPKLDKNARQLPLKEV